MSDHAVVADEPLALALLDFAVAPGRYALRLREPRLLHVHIDTLALWATGRLPPALQPQRQALQDAAIFFLQRACFAPDNTHYQVLGILPQAALAEPLRTRYRALIRLTHPDMGIEGLDPHAAGRVNRAHEVLSNPVLRRQYDDKLAHEATLAWPHKTTVGGATKTAYAARSAPAQHGAHGAHAPDETSSVPWSGYSHSQSRRHTNMRKPEGGRWYALAARYPALTRTLLATSGAGLLVVGVIVFAAQESHESGMLLVARAPTHTAQRPEPQQQHPKAKTNSTQALAATKGQEPPPTLRPVSPLPLVLPSVVPKQVFTAPAPAPAPLLVASPPAAKTVAGIAPEAPRPSAAPFAVVAAAPPTVQPIQTQRPAAAVDAFALAPTPPLAQSLPAGSELGSALARAESPAPESALPITAVAVSLAAPPPARPAGAVPVVTAGGTGVAAVAVAQATASPAPDAAPAPATVAVATSSAPAWEVNIPQARLYLTDLVTLLERPQDVQRAQNHLLQMNVKGTLLGPALRLLQQYPQVKVEQMAISGGERIGAGTANIAALVSVRASNAQATPAPTLNFRFTARFIGTREGTALAHLDMREAK